MTTESKSPLVDSRNARIEGYREIIEDIIADGSCPLCPPMKWHPNPILKSNNRWFITENFHPYPNTSHHFLIVCEKHIENLVEISSKDMGSILRLVRWASEEFNIIGGGLTMRFGDTLYTGATIKHLHAHLIVPTVEEGQVSPVYFPIG